MGLEGRRGDQEGPSLVGLKNKGNIIAQGQERHCHVGPGGTWLENQEGCHRRARKAVVARSGGMLLNGAGGTIIGRLGGPGWRHCSGPRGTLLENQE